MKTEEIRRAIGFMRGPEQPKPTLVEYAQIREDAEAELAAIEAKNAAMREAISGALRIETLWVPREVSSEHADEARAVHAMRQAFLDALSAQPADTTNHCPLCEGYAVRIAELEVENARGTIEECLAELESIIHYFVNYHTKGVGQLTHALAHAESAISAEPTGKEVTPC